MTKQILFVDDDPQILHSYKLALEKQYKIMTAESGELALDLLAENSFAVIVSDMRMPGMDGAQFLSEARKIAPDTVRIMLTGYAEVETAIQAVNSGQIFRFRPHRFSLPQRQGQQHGHGYKRGRNPQAGPEPMELKNHA